MNFEQEFEESYERLVGHGVGITARGQRFFTRFYENFLARSPRIKDHFEHTDMSKQIIVLQKAMYHMISFYLLHEPNELLERVAASHSRAHHGIEPELYDEWLEALLLTVEQMDPDYNRDLRLAWQIVMMPGILYMQRHY